MKVKKQLKEPLTAKALFVTVLQQFLALHLVMTKLNRKYCNTSYT